MKSVKSFAIWTLSGQTFLFLYIRFILPTSEASVYGTNDDALMASISGGSLTGSPDGHLIFINPLLSFPISWLTIIFNSFNIYTFFLVLVVTLSFSIVLGVIQTISRENKFKIINLIFWSISALTFVSWFSMAPTYTGASIFATGASVCFAYLIISELNNNKSINKILLISFSFLFTISISIRQESIYIFFILFLSIFILKIKRNRFAFKKLINVMLITSISFGGIFLLEKIVYTNDKWSEYYETNSLRHKIQLREPERQLEKTYQNIDWNRDTYDLFIRFILVDESKMNSTNMQKIIDSTENSFTTQVETLFNFDSLQKNIRSSFAAWTWIIMLFGLQIFISASLSRPDSHLKKYLGQIFLLGVNLIFLFHALSTLYHIPERITLNTLGAISLILIVLSAELFSQTSLILKIRYVIFFILLIFGSFNYLQRFQIELEARKNLYITWRSISDQQSASLSLLDRQLKVTSGASTLKSDWRNPYLKFVPLDPRDKTLILGWHNLSPIWDSNIAWQGLSKSNFYGDVLTQDILWASNIDDLEVIERIFKNLSLNAVTTTDLGPIGYEQFHYYKFSN